MTREPYRPSNGTEGDIFYSAWCAKCTRDSGPDDACDILVNIYALPIDDPAYPVEWREDGPSGPRCTAFEPIDPAVQPLDPGAVVRALI